MTNQIKTYLDTVTSQDGTIHCYVSGQTASIKEALKAKGFTRDTDGKFWYNQMPQPAINAMAAELNLTIVL